jgi:hypothetical protein
MVVVPNEGIFTGGKGGNRKDLILAGLKPG